MRTLRKTKHTNTGQFRLVLFICLVCRDQYNYKQERSIYLCRFYIMLTPGDRMLCILGWYVSMMWFTQFKKSEYTVYHIYVHLSYNTTITGS